MVAWPLSARRPRSPQPAAAAGADRGRRDRAGGAARLPRRADRGCADRAFHPPDRADRREPRACSNASASRSRGGDELARLAQTFNATLDALEGSIAVAAQPRRRRLARAAHADRDAPRQPPADARRAAAARAEDREALRADMIEELDELTRLVSDVVELARGSKPSGERGRGAPRPDRRRGGRAGAPARPAADRSRLSSSRRSCAARASGSPAPSPTCSTTPSKWSPDGGVVEVDLRDGVLSVRDHGPGFHEEDLPFVFDRFHRAARRALEAGLGARAGDRAPGGRGPRRVRRGRQRARRRRDHDDQLRAGRWSSSRTAPPRRGQWRRGRRRCCAGTRHEPRLIPVLVTVTVIARAPGRQRPRAPRPRAGRRSRHR